MPSAAPSLRARLVALLAITIAGACGGLVGYAITDLHCQEGCPTMAGAVGLVSSALAAAGVAIVAFLALRAMSEWQTGTRQQGARDHHPVD